MLAGVGPSQALEHARPGSAEPILATGNVPDPGCAPRPCAHNPTAWTHKEQVSWEALRGTNQSEQWRYRGADRSGVGRGAITRTSRMSRTICRALLEEQERFPRVGVGAFPAGAPVRAEAQRRDKKVKDLPSWLFIDLSSWNIPSPPRQPCPISGSPECRPRPQAMTPKGPTLPLHLLNWKLGVTGDL